MTQHKLTPAMQQHARFKDEHPGCVLAFRMGDFYELFGQDAVDVAKAIGLTLTQRTAGLPMAGVPHHQFETYLRKMIDAGFRVAVADQVQDPKDAKGVVQRAVTRVVTPGTVVDESLLAEGAVCLIAAVEFLDPGDADDAEVALAVVDFSTGAFRTMRTTASRVPDDLARFGLGAHGNSAELLHAQTADAATPPRVAKILHALGIDGTPCPAWYFRPEEAVEALHTQFNVSTLEGFGIERDDRVVGACGALVRHLRHTQTIGEDTELPAWMRRSTLAHLRPPIKVSTAGHCEIDATSLRSLEILSARDGSRTGSLVSVFERSGSFTGCRTAPGRRLLREWLARPLCDLGGIERRQSRVAALADDSRFAGELADALDGVQDVARIAGRVALGRATPRDLVGLGRSIARAPALRETVADLPAFADTSRALAELAATLTPLAERINSTCVDDPPAHMREGGLVREGVDAELDEARTLETDAGRWAANYQAKLIETHELPSLKVGYNKVFGYYIELPGAQAKRAPDAFTRKQTLKNAERYITPELKEFEDKVTTARTRAVQRELDILNQLCDRAASRLDPIARYADVVAELDVLLCFADKARARRWTRPEIVETGELSIEEGRHPVLDELLETASSRHATADHGFVANSLTLGGDAAHLALITGPNMSGKSTFIRQSALLTLLSHAGSFVPAARMRVGLTDRIFTRIGAEDALVRGQSTFMVEMTETARILHHATGRSLVILDEIGRGTSTLDGLSLAWAIAENLALRDGPPRTLFATHYHELTQLAERLDARVTNLHVAVREWGDDIVFLHRILEGRADRSYGIHVAKLAGLPRQTVERAQEVLEGLAVHEHNLEAGAQKTSSAGETNTPQMSLFTEYVRHPVVDELREVKLEALSPLEAFDLLRQMHERATDPDR